MTKKDIDNLLKNELLLINIKKYPRDNFAEKIFGQWMSIFTVIYFFILRKKSNHFVLTKNRILLIIRRRVINNIEINENSKLYFDRQRPKIDILAEGKPDQVILLEKMRLTNSDKNKIDGSLKKLNTEFEINNR